MPVAHGRANCREHPRNRGRSDPARRRPCHPLPLAERAGPL